MKIFHNKKDKSLFVTLSDSFKTAIGREKFTEKCKELLMSKQLSLIDLDIFQITDKEVEIIYNETKKLYV